jgi:hypothetical protein
LIASRAERTAIPINANAVKMHGRRTCLLAPRRHGCCSTKYQVNAPTTTTTKIAISASRRARIGA